MSSLITSPFTRDDTAEVVSEGIDLTGHPLFVRRAPRCLKQVTALHPGDSFDLYAL